MSYEQCFSFYLKRKYLDFHQHVFCCCVVVVFFFFFLFCAKAKNKETGRMRTEIKQIKSEQLLKRSLNLSTLKLTDDVDIFGKDIYSCLRQV